MADSEHAPGGGGDISADDVLAMWRVLVARCADPDLAERALRAAVRGRDRGASDSRVALWWACVAELDALRNPSEFEVIMVGALGPHADDVLAVSEFIAGLASPAREVALASYIARLAPEDVAVIGRVDRAELRGLREEVEDRALRLGVASPRRWRDLLAPVGLPLDPDRLLSRGPQRRGLGLAATGGALLFVVLVVWLSSGAGPQRGETAAPAAAPVDLARAPTEPDPAPLCPGATLASKVRVSPVYQRRLQPTVLADSVAAADVVVAGTAASLSSRNGSVYFELADPELLSGGHVDPPSEFRLAGRLDPTVPAASAQVVAFLRRDNVGWLVSESGGLWADCDDAGVPVGAQWSPGEDWPMAVNASTLEGAIAAIAADNEAIELTAHGGGVSGGFRLNDGRIVVVDAAAGAISEPLSAVLAPSAETLAVVRSAEVTITLSGAPCRAFETRDCGPAAPAVEVAPVDPDGAVDGPAVDVYVLTEFDAVGATGLALVRSEDDLVRAIDLSARMVRWSTSATASARFISGDGDIAVVDDAGLRVVDVEAGAPRWAAPIASTSEVVRVGPGWLVLSATRQATLSLLDAATGEALWSLADIGEEPRLVGIRQGIAVIESGNVTAREWHGVEVSSGESLWRADAEGFAMAVETSRAVDTERGLLAILDTDGAVSLIDLGTGRARWQTHVADADTIVGIWINMMTVRTSSGHDVKVALADGFILPP